MKLLFLIGNCAVGKMTVGQELAKVTPFRLFHNHMTIEPVLEVFGSFHINTILRLRDVIFEEFAATDHYGMIFTLMLAFDSPVDMDYLDHIKQIFHLPEEDVYYVELVASQEVRLARNVTENRLAHKASKRDIQASNARLLRDDRTYRYESLPGELPYPNYLRIENGGISPGEAAAQIKAHFSFPDP